MTQNRPRLFYGYWILLVGFLSQVIMNGFVSYAFSLYVIPLDVEFGWSRAAIMTGNLVAMLVTGFASPLVGRIVYKWSAKRVIAGGALVMGIGFVLLALIHSSWQFYLSYAIVGLGSAATGVIPISIVAANWFKKRHGFATAIIGTGIGIGGLVMPLLLGTYVIPNFGWRMAYLVSAIISVAILIPLSLLIVKERPEDIGLLPDNGETGENKHHHTSEATEPGVKLGQALQTPAFWLMASAFITFGIANGNIFQNHVPHLQDIGFSATVAASALSAVGIGSAIGKFGFGWLCDYIPPKYILVIGSVSQAASTLILMNVTPSSSAFTLWLYAFLLGLGIGSWFPAISMTSLVTFGLVAYGVIFGIYTMIFQIAGAFGPWLGGYIFDTTGGYHLAFVLGLILYAITVLCMLLVSRSRLKKLP